MTFPPVLSAVKEAEHTIARNYLLLRKMSFENACRAVLSVLSIVSKVTFKWGDGGFERPIILS